MLLLISLLVLPTTLPAQTVGSAFGKKECPCIAPFSTFSYSFKRFNLDSNKRDVLGLVPELYLGGLFMADKFVVGVSYGIFQHSLALHGGIVFQLKKEK